MLGADTQGCKGAHPYPAYLQMKWEFNMNGFNFFKPKSFDNPPHGEFWYGFREHIKKEGSNLSHFGSLSTDNLYDLKNDVSFSGCDFGVINKPEFKFLWLTGALNPKKYWLSAKLTLLGDLHKDLFDVLKKDSIHIERHFSTQYKFEWDDPPRYSIGLLRDNINLADKNSWDELFEWVRINLEELEHVVINRFALYFYEIKTNTMYNHY